MINASLKNYRPISVLPFISKTFEKIVADSVIHFLYDHDIIYNKQFGFRKRHSTTHAIIALTEKVSMALDSGKIVGVYSLLYSFHCIYVYVYCIYFSSMFIYFIVCQLYYMSYWLSAKNSTISSIVFGQCSSCFIDFSIMLEMVLTQPYFND